MEKTSDNFKIIHISDLHVDSDYDNNRIFEAFLNSLQLHIKGGCVLVISGDVTNKGDFSEKQLQILRERITRIKDDLPTDTKIIFCPGNHDLNLKKIDTAVASFIENCKNGNGFIESLNDDNANLYLKHMNDYYNLVEEFDFKRKSNLHLHITEIIDYENKKIGFASINSAWSAGGKGETDYGKILIAERQLDLSLEELKDCDLKIAVMHHTFDWISLKEKNYIQNSFSRNFDILLCGHNHNHQMNSTSSNLGNILINNTGCLYQSREYFNGYSVITLPINENGFNQVIIDSQEYYSDRDTFDVSTRFSEGGRKELTLKKNTYLLPTLPMTIYEKISNNASSKLLSTSSAVAPKNIQDIFVEPPMAKIDEKTFYNKQELGAQKSEIKNDPIITLNDLAGVKSNILLYGKKETGKTTILDFIATQKYLDFHPTALIGVVIEVNKAKHNQGRGFNENSILNYILNHLDNEFGKKELINLLNEGAFLVCFDNLNISKPSEVKAIESFVKKYEKCRYICTIQEDILKTGIDINTRNSLEGFSESIYIHSFKENHTKELLGKWFDSIDISTESKNKKLIIKLISQLNVPSTPFLISALLWVIEQNSMTNHLINQALVLEVLLDGLLDKFKESKSRAGYDSKIISSFLTEFSYYLDNNSEEFIGKQDFENFVTQYFAKRSLAQPDNFSKDIVGKGILFESNDLIGFKFDCFRAFYLSIKFSEDSQIWKDIISNETFAQYYSEFDFFTGISRNEKETLISFKDKCATKEKSKAVLNEEIKEEGFSILDVGFIEDIQEHDDFEDVEIEDREVPSNTSLDHDKGRTRKMLLSGNEEDDWLGLLIMYSICLRNGELIEDVELKQESIEDILYYWAIFIKTKLKELNLVNLDEILDSQIFKEAFKTSNDKAIEPINKVTLNFILETLLSTSILSLMTSKVSTPKLKIVLEKVINSDDSTPEYEYVKILAYFCLIDSDLSIALNNLKRLTKIFSKHQHFSNILFLKLFYIYTMEENNSNMNIKLKQAITDLQLSSTDNKQVRDRKEVLIKKLEQQKKKIKSEIDSN